MRKDIDFSNAKRGALIGEPGKERITIRLDAEVLAWFRAQVKGGGNYQTLINEALRGYIGERDGALERVLRRVIREELHAAA
ncbi:MAG: BrnA antitoxin family protein [Proteobacteria bacterium]|nr:BrnA antitoxin family protein [Pseudomonadota bacterium]MBS0462482.1 BrnA antitoxin family protein [Pseudomonadota bacterium]MBS0464601.1 BrnA antitoxin family protein [Pseudomonadota bacterium]